MQEELKPQWMANHEQADLMQFELIHQSLKSIESKIDPVYNAYNTAGTMARWAKISFGSIVLLLTGLAAWLQIIGKHQ